MELGLPVESESTKGSGSECEGDWVLGASRVEGRGGGRGEERRFELGMQGVGAMERTASGKEDIGARGAGRKQRLDTAGLGRPNATLTRELPRTAGRRDGNVAGRERVQ